MEAFTHLRLSCLTSESVLGQMTLKRSMPLQLNHATKEGFKRKASKKAQKAGSRLAEGDDAFQFYRLEEEEGLGYCILCE
jgi:hypothetical protein